MLQQTKELLSFKAFKPSKLDVKVSLIERFYKDGSIMGVSISKNSLTCAEIQFTQQSEISISKIKTFFINCEEQVEDEERLKIITAFAKENKLFHVLLFNSSEIQILKVDEGFHKIDINRLHDVKYSMDKILPEESEENRTYAYVSNPKLEETLIFSYHQEKIDWSARLINSTGLEVVRVTCSIYAIIDYLFNAGDQTEFFSQNQILLIYSSHCLFVASICENSFQQIGFRANIEVPDISSHISKMIERFEYNHTQVFYVNCSDWDIKTYFSQNYPFLKVVPVFPDSFKGAFQAAAHG